MATSTLQSYSLLKRSKYQTQYNSALSVIVITGCLKCNVMNWIGARSPMTSCYSTRFTWLCLKVKNTRLVGVVLANNTNRSLWGTLQRCYFWITKFVALMHWKSSAMSPAVRKKRVRCMDPFITKHVNYSSAKWDDHVTVTLPPVCRLHPKMWCYAFCCLICVYKTGIELGMHQPTFVS
jgi:hypothetical protein